MAIQKTTSAAEHDWYATRSGLATDATLNAHKAQYFISKGFGGNLSIHPPISQMESDWLANVGSSTANSPYELWVNACQAQSVPVGSTIDECKRNFFLGVAPGTNP